MENISFYVGRKIISIFSGDNIRYINELRGEGLTRIFYNKILIVLFPIWVFTIIKIIREKRFKALALLSVFGIIAAAIVFIIALFGQNELAVRFSAVLLGAASASVCILLIFHCLS
ncbi:MAG: hypothetical protein AAB656_03650 [Patescibacteria group bacterium]